MSLRDSIPGDAGRPDRWAKLLRNLEKFVTANAGNGVTSTLFGVWPPLGHGDFELVQEARLMCTWLAEELDKPSEEEK